MADEGEETVRDRERPEGDNETRYFNEKGRGKSEVMEGVGSSST